MCQLHNTQKAYKQLWPQPLFKNVLLPANVGAQTQLFKSLGGDMKNTYRPQTPIIYYPCLSTPPPSDADQSSVYPSFSVSVGFVLSLFFALEEYLLFGSLCVVIVGNS